LQEKRKGLDKIFLDSNNHYASVRKFGFEKLEGMCAVSL
jgi:hypothetical protein